MSTDPDAITSLMWVGHRRSHPVLPDRWRLFAEIESVDRVLDEPVNRTSEGPSIVLVDLTREATDG